MKLVRIYKKQICLIRVPHHQKRKKKEKKENKKKKIKKRSLRNQKNLLRNLQMIVILKKN